MNGTKLFDSLSPFHDAELSVLDINASRVPGYLGRGLFSRQSRFRES